jgi:predicted small lipoprotein YifL
MKKSFSLSLIIAFAVVTFWGCEKKGDPPALPPAESMTIDFSYFTSSKKSATIVPETKGNKAVENTNWTVAATVAGVWNTILVTNLAIPVAAFNAAIENKASYLENKKWQWSYSVNVLAATYKARLTGQLLTDEVKWEMYISKEGVQPFAEFKWFEGTTSLDGKSGQWILTQSQAEQVPMLQIDWEKTGSEIGSVIYTYIKTGEAFKDSYIEYGKTTGDLDAFYNVHFWETNRAKFVDVNIKWSTTLYNGRVKSLEYFQNENWHCWDGNGNDTDCPAK